MINNWFSNISFLELIIILVFFIVYSYLFVNVVFGEIFQRYFREKFEYQVAMRKIDLIVGMEQENPRKTEERTSTKEEREEIAR